MQITCMKYFYVHSDDARWLRRWLGKNLAFVLVMAWLLILLRFETSAPLQTMNPLRAAQLETDPGETTRLSDAALLSSRFPTAVAPEGWRRTKRGWENTSSWPLLPRPLGEIIRLQEDREPAWMQLALANVREVPPLVFGLIQITAIAVILNFTTSSGEAKPDRSAG